MVTRVSSSSVASRQAFWLSLSPAEFEEYVAEVFRLQGYRVQVAGGHGSGDGGVDLILYKDDQKFVAQCKRYARRNWVKVEEMRAFSAVVRRTGAARGFFVTSSIFSKQARAWAAGDPIDLIDAYKLVSMDSVSLARPVFSDPPVLSSSGQAAPAVDLSDQFVVDPPVYRFVSLDRDRSLFTPLQWIVLGILSFVVLVVFAILFLVIAGMLV